MEEKGVSGAVPLVTGKELKNDLEDADADSEKAHRKAIKANIKASDAAEIFEWLNPGPASESE